MDLILAILVFLPILCGFVSYWIGRRSKPARDAFVLAVTVLELCLVLAIFLQGSLSFQLPGFCGLGVSFASGGFRSVMAFLTASGWVTATVLSREYFAHVKYRNRYYLFWLMTLGATMGVFLSADLFSTFIFFEVMSFTSYVAVVQTEESAARTAGGTYLAVAVIGGLVTLSGLFLLFHSLGTLRISELAHAAAAADPAVLRAGGLLTLVGFAAKAGAFPLHIWLPTAHPAAPAPASAVLSGVITKTGIYGVAVLSTTLFLHSAPWGMILAVIGAITMVLGAALAVCSVDLKRTLACSSVSQIGFILVGLSMQCLLGHHNALAVDGTILHILNHSLIKMVLFPIAGIIHLSTHSYNLNSIRGFGRGKPLLAVLSGIPMLSLAGLPLLNGYVSKTLLHESIVEYIHLAENQAWLFTALEWVFLFAGGLTFAYMLKLFFCIFVEEPARPFHSPHGTRYIARASAAVLAVYVTVMPLLGSLPNLSMDAVAAFARAFFHSEAPAHAVHYFSFVNLKGSIISLTVGALVYLLVVRKLLIRQQRYLDPIPQWCNLEYRLYRPLLALLTKVVLSTAVVVDKLSFRLLFKTLPAIFKKRWQQLHEHLVRLATAMSGEPYTPPSLEHTVHDHHFALYADDPPLERSIFHSFAFGLLLTGLGLVFSLLFILPR